jgi:hypothetical protein
MKEQGNNYSAIRNYVRPVISFYKINDIILNTTKIGKFMPSKTCVNGWSQISQSGRWMETDNVYYC